MGGVGNSRPGAMTGVALGADARQFDWTRARDGDEMPRVIRPALVALAALSGLTACRRPAPLREPPVRLAHPLGTFSAGALRGTLTATAASRPLGALRGTARSKIELKAPSVLWEVEVRAAAAVPGAQGSLGVLYRCAFETRSLVAAELRAALSELRASTASSPDGRAVVAVRAPRWSLPCAAPTGAYRAVYLIGGSALLGGRTLPAASPEEALRALPDGVGWLREALRSPPSPSPAPVPSPIVPGESLPTFFPAGTGFALAAMVVAAKEGVALDEALAYSLNGPSLGLHPPSEARLLERLRANAPPSLRGVVLEALVPPTQGPLERSSAAWGRRVGEALPDPAGGMAALDAALAACAEPARAHRCGPWRVGAMRAIASRVGDPTRLAAVAGLAWRLPRAWSAPRPRAQARIEALRAAATLPDPAAAIRAATAMLGGSEADPARPAEGDGPRGRLLEEQPEAKWAAAATLVGRCDPEVVAAANAGLRAVEHPARVAAACVLSRCMSDPELESAIERAAPRNPLNARVLPLRPGWCTSPDASAPPP
ncbi:MAG: hypothetical protein R3A48_00745 [Polyangiales bacterium]